MANEIDRLFVWALFSGLFIAGQIWTVAALIWAAIDGSYWKAAAVTIIAAVMVGMTLAVYVDVRKRWVAMTRENGDR